MKYRELIAGIFWLVFGLLLSIWSTRYQIGNIIKTGPGFLPLVLGSLLIFFSLILLGRAKKSSSAKGTVPPFFLPDGWKKVAYAVLILLLSIFLFETIGYLITIFLLIGFLMLGAELQSWRKILFIALFTALGVYLVFVLLLEQQLPRGLLGI